MKHNWEYKRLGDVCDIVGGSTPKTEVEEYWNGDLNWFTPAEISDKKYYATSERKITKEAVKATGLTLMPPGTVLLTSRAPIGKVGIATEYCYCNQGFKNLICKDGLFNEYLYYTLLYLKQDIIEKGRGATFKEISKKITETIPIPVPPMEVQEQIVAELDKINEVIADCKKLLSNLDALAQSLFYTTFGDPITNPHSWPVKTIQSIANTTAGGTPSKSHAEYYENGNILWLRSGEVCKMNITDTELRITDLGLQNSSAKLIPINSVVVAMYGATAGQVGIIRKEMSLNQAICAILPNKSTSSIYLYFCLSSLKENLLKDAHGAAQPNISQAIIKSLPIPLPPLSLQEEFAERIEAIEEQKKAVEQTIATLQTLLAARMDYWFND